MQSSFRFIGVFKSPRVKFSTFIALIIFVLSIVFLLSKTTRVIDGQRRDAEGIMHTVTVDVYEDDGRCMCRFQDCISGSHLDKIVFSFVIPGTESCHNVDIMEIILALVLGTLVIKGVNLMTVWRAYMIHQRRNK